MKACRTCGETKDLDQFSERKKGSGVRKSECRACVSARARAWNQSNPERVRETQKRYRSKNLDDHSRRQAEYRKRIKETPGARWEQIKRMSHTLYRFRGADGSLLYVGITSCFDYRMEQHELRQPWWAEVSAIEQEEYPDRSSADSAETIAIRTENPRYNIRKR